MPVISSATTSGTIVICSALSHSAADRLGDRRRRCSTQAPPAATRGDPDAEADDQGEQDPGRLREFQKRRPSDAYRAIRPYVDGRA